MCRKTALLGSAIAAVGIGFILSSFFQSVVLSILIGAVLVGIGLLIIYRN